MSYQPPHHGPYPPQYLQHPRQHPQQPIQPPQFLYNNINPAQQPYQYGKPVVYPQVSFSNFNAYGQAFNNQHHPQQPLPQQQPQQQQQQPPPPPPQDPPQPQYVNPADLFQAPMVSSIPSQFSSLGTSQYTEQPAVPITNNNTNNDVNLSPVMPTVSAAQPPYYPASSAGQGDNNSYGQYPQIAQKSPVPMQAKAAPASAPTPTPAAAPTPATMAPIPSSAPTPVAAPIATPASVPPSAPPSASKMPTPNSAPAPTRKPIPQVVVPAPSLEVQQKMKQQTSKKQAQRKSSNLSAQKPGKPPIDYQVLLLSLADEYLNAAHSHGTMVALQRREMDVEEYYKLLATGLGCLEAVLKVSGYLTPCD